MCWSPTAATGVLEIGAIIGVAAAGALWRMAFMQGSMKSGMDGILHELQMLRSELSKDIHELDLRISDHEVRIRDLERR